jgi:hypothetical protein
MEEEKDYFKIGFQFALGAICGASIWVACAMAVLLIIAKFKGG